MWVRGVMRDAVGSFLNAPDRSSWHRAAVLNVTNQGGWKTFPNFIVCISFCTFNSLILPLFSFSPALLIDAGFSSKFSFLSYTHTPHPFVAVVHFSSLFFSFSEATRGSAGKRFSISFARHPTNGTFRLFVCFCLFLVHPPPSSWPLFYPGSGPPPSVPSLTAGPCHEPWTRHTDAESSRRLNLKS